MRIDAHCHVLSQAYMDAIPTPGGNLSKPPVVTVEALESMMERYAIDRAVVCTGPPGLFFGDQAQANELGRLVNEEMKAILQRDPGRFAVLGMVPLPDIGAALAELDHLLDVLRLDGVVLTTHVAGTYLGDDALEPLYAELDRRGTYVFVHPTIPANGVPLGHPAWLYEFPFETVRAIANLIYSGTFERYPSIRWQFPHLGGAAPFLAHRLASLAEREAPMAERAPAGALEYLARVYYDTGLSNNEVAVRAALQIAPADHILFGTDWPYLAMPEAPGDPAPGLAFLGEDRAAIDGAQHRCSDTTLGMIFEHALIVVTPGQDAAFETAFQGAPAIFAKAAGCHGVELRRCIEEHHYLLIVRWETLEDHTVGFRESPLFAEWRGLVSDHFAEPPRVLHYETVA